MVDCRQPSCTFARLLQLGEVLNFKYPELFSNVIELLKPLMDVWSLVFSALGPGECFGLQGFGDKWMLRVLGLPVILGSAIILYHVVYDRHSNGAEAAWMNTKTFSFLSVFFAYPMVVVVSFATFVCTPLSPSWSVLEADNTILCEDKAHMTMQVASVLVIALFAVGMPVGIGVVVLRVMGRYESETSGLHVEMVTRLAEEMQCDRLTAQFVVRDVSIGSEFSVLINSCACLRPQPPAHRPTV